MEVPGDLCSFLFQVRIRAKGHILAFGANMTLAITLSYISSSILLGSEGGRSG